MSALTPVAPAPSRAPRVGLQTKLLLPVVACLVLLPLIVGAIVLRAINQQQESGARAQLATAQRVFELGLDQKRQDYLSRFRPLAVTSQFIPVATLLALPEKTEAALKTMRQALEGGLLGQLRDECQFVVYTPNPPASLAPIIAHQLGDRSHPARPLDDRRVVAAARPIIEEAQAQGEGTGVVTVDDQGFYIIAAPTIAGDGQTLGFVTFGVRLDSSALGPLKEIIGAQTELILSGPGGVIASTLPGRAVPAAGPDGMVLINGIHYLALSGNYDAVASNRGFGYTLLSPFEDNLRVQADLTRLVLGVSVAGVILSVIGVWFFTQRSMRPLHELRDSAEAVGRGDFSRRISRFSNDECGDLADAFNRMTGNLQQSRAELETTVTTLQNTQHQLVQSEKLSAVGQFVSGVAHELNNPLAAVIGFSELLAQTATDDSIRPHLDMIAKSAQRCHKIVHNLLSFARQHPPERKLVVINSVVEEVLDFMAYEFRTSNIAIERRLAPGLPAILADSHQLQQVFVNILGNARQAIQGFRRDGKIVARTTLDGQRIRVDLIDDGPGIRPENLSRIFDPFFTTKPVGKGTGLGLSLTYGIVREHGGTIRAESVVGHGATFIIELPVAAQQQARTEARRGPAKSAAPASPSGRTVLVVDDEEWLLALASDLLRQDGHVPVTAQSGEEAINVLSRRRVDLIISDWKMPGLSGAAFFEHLQAVHPRAAERIFFMTGDVMNDGLQEFMARHGKICLAKPFPIDEFRTTVTAQLAASAS